MYHYSIRYTSSLNSAAKRQSQFFSFCFVILLIFIFSFCLAPRQQEDYLSGSACQRSVQKSLGTRPRRGEICARTYRPYEGVIVYTSSYNIPAND